MLYKGRKVEYVRDAARNDPYYDPEYDQAIVTYVDTMDRETVKKSELDGWDEENKRGTLTDAEKRQAQDLNQARKDADQARLDSDSSVAQRPVVQPVPVTKPTKK